MDLDQLFTNTDYITVSITLPCHRQSDSQTFMYSRNEWIENEHIEAICDNNKSNNNRNNSNNNNYNNNNDRNNNDDTSIDIVRMNTRNDETGVVSQENDHKSPAEDHVSSMTVEVDCSQAASTDYDLTGQILWPVSVLLSHYITSNRGQDLLKGRHVVELGAGCGLPGLVAAHFANRVLLTDGNDVVLDLLTRNANKGRMIMSTSEYSGGVVKAAKLQWGNRIHWMQVMDTMNGNVDIVIAADVIQWPAVVEPFLHTVKAVLWDSRAKVPTLVLGIVNRAQTTYDLFFTLAKELGFSWAKVPAEAFLKDGVLPKSCQEFGGRSTEIFEVVLLDRSVYPILHSHTQNVTLGMTFENTPFLPC